MNQTPTPTDSGDVNVSPLASRRRAKRDRGTNFNMAEHNLTETIPELLAGAVKRIISGEATIAELGSLHALIALVRSYEDDAAVALLARGESYREVAEAIGVTRQAAMQRWPRASQRPVGGQSSGHR